MSADVAAAGLAQLDINDPSGTVTSSAVDQPITIPSLLITNSYFDEVTENIRERPMPWEGYQRASLITENELLMLRNYSAKTGLKDKELAHKYIDLFLGLMGKLSRMDALQYILVAFDDAIHKYPETLDYLVHLARQPETSPFAALKRCLGKEDDYLNLKAAMIITEVLNREDSRTVEQFDFSDILLWLTRQLQSENPNVVDVGVQILQGLLKVERFRGVLYNHVQAMNTLTGLIHANRSGNPQMLYQLLFCIWLLSFDGEASATMDKRYGVIAQAVAIAKAATKEKLARIILATLRNLLTLAPEENQPSMLVNKVLNLCDNLASRKWTDADIPDDVTFLRDELTERFQKLTTWDEYVSEVESGHLSWTPSHNSDAFWKLHAAKLADENAHLFHALVACLAQPDQDPTVLAVAAHDIGQFAKYYSQGKKLVQESGAKAKVMELMTHPNPDVKYQALVAVQILMSHAWEQ
ncbi:H(+)-transporting V1 sector ATPase subunit H [Tieghemiomyces parasiticus]|uniref:V-type proton ATPase subunit H n=1 Tax=Tieghemiomyces parasiticus TaxID=78921 RepID=A0A9W8AA13_9FUNG|nr:H(+)-transporting V1 sector ATPase subunit H [Tieghemiomyces parasiticus]